MPGKSNIVADYLSRIMTDLGDGMLAPEIFSLISQVWRVKTNLFASHWNHQLVSFRLMAFRPRVLSGSCIQPQLEVDAGISFPTVCDHPTVFNEYQGGSGHCHLDNSLLASTSMVSDASGIIVRCSTDFADAAKSFDKCSGPTPSATETNLIILVAWGLSGDSVNRQLSI